MDPRLFLLAVILAAALLHHAEAEIGIRTDIWNPRAKDRKSKVAKLTWDEFFKKLYLDCTFKSGLSFDFGSDIASEFFYNHVLPKAEDIEELDLKCVPGRTLVHIIEKPPEPEIDSSDEYDDMGMLRSHMNTGMKEEFCKVCVCSVDGKDEYCSQRPAVNVNECLQMTKIMENFQSNEPYDHTRTLAYRIRRDYIYHNDEIPYEPKAKCRRGHSYYSNSLTANDTDIDVASDVESLLDYSNKTVCFYCVCSVSGTGVGCLSRLPWFCEYYRNIRQEDAPRDRYRTMFQQDRPTYFRQLSWRLRRTMDDGMYDFMDNVGVDDEKGDSSQCVPFVSEYTDCTDENTCTGCNKCVCIGENKWSCQPVSQCPGEDKEDKEATDVDEDTLDSAFFSIQNEIEAKESAKAASSSTRYVPSPTDDKDLLLDFASEGIKFDEHIKALLRNKRSVVDDTNHTTDGVKFHNTVDELNEDTLKHENLSGTLQAHKVKAIPIPFEGTRRTGLLTTDNLSQNSLQIEHKQTNVYDDPLTDNKIDAAVHNNDKFDATNEAKISKIIGNRTQKQKDKDLSKLIVKELKPGTEVIGDKQAPIMSNITFTPENDTLTAMAFIAGNLLNKLWNMEKGSYEESREIESLKHEKISDLLDLFKEPLNLRQESFLKNALQQLSKAINKDKTLDNVSLCKKLNESLKIDDKNDTNPEESNENNESKVEINSKTRKAAKTESPVNVNTISKISNVLSLIKKFEKVHSKINHLKHTEEKKTIKRKGKETNTLTPTLASSEKSNLTQDESESLNVFGSILEKITKLLMPPKKSKKIVKSIRNQNVLKNTDAIANTIKNMFNIDVDNSSLTVKDRMVFDYLNTVKRNPKCLLDNMREDTAKSVSSIEGDILLNLSEFFKVKSFVDLVKILEPESTHSTRSKDITTTDLPEVSMKTTMTTTEVTTTTQLSNKLFKTKEKLKTHLKSILEDLVELQNAKGHPDNNINLVDALPCIYKILNANNNQNIEQKNKKTDVSHASKVAAIFDALKKDLKATQNRRSNTVTGPRPKSAVVWERIVKNVDGKNKQKTRRYMEVTEPKTFEEIKIKMDRIESSSKTYKNVALTNGVTPSERLVLLKTLLEDIRQYINVLDDINNSIPNLRDISDEDKSDIKEFIYNSAANVDLDKKIAKNILASANGNNVHSIVNKNAVPKRENYMPTKSMKMLDVTKLDDKNNLKLSRDAIINQLIKNRMKLYVKIKELKGIDLSSDLNYDIAKKILLYLDYGNTNLARELYKVLIMPKQKAVNPTAKSVSAPLPMKKPEVLHKESLIQFEEPKSKVQWLSQDAWLKQLVNLKNMRA